MGKTSRPWWQDAVVYEVYVRSLADIDGDGVGDLPGIRSRLPYLRELGVDALWLTPFYPSPQADHGYDVADHRGVEPISGTLDDLDALVADAHGLGLRVMIDIVPNHTSSAHVWFQQALASEPGSAARARYLFRPGRGRGGSLPPNNWKSIFGGIAWTRVPDGEWYLHLFDSAQPDLDWTNPEVGDELESILRFWLDRGVDGIRVDVAHGLAKAPGLPDERRGEPKPYEHQPAVHEVYRRWRRLLDGYAGDRFAVAEAWAPPSELTRYTRPDELHQAFDFELLLADWSAASYRRAITDSLAVHEDAGSTASWVLSNHDVVRHRSRYGDGDGDSDMGLARARAGSLLALALPGSAYLYQGEELGLPQVDVAPEDRQDPAWFRSGGAWVGRDGCRVPLPWSGMREPYGFGPGTGPTWLPQPAGWGELAVDRQAGVTGSTLELYRRALALRREHLAGAEHDVRWLPSGPGILAFARGAVVCTTNFTDRPRRVPATATLLVASGTPDDAPVGAPVSAGSSGTVLLPPATTAWWLTGQ